MFFCLFRCSPFGNIQRPNATIALSHTVQYIQFCVQPSNSLSWIIIDSLAQFDQALKVNFGRPASLLVVFSSTSVVVGVFLACRLSCAFGSYYPSTQEWFTWCCWISWHRRYFLQCMYHFLLGMHFLKLHLHSQSLFVIIHIVLLLV